MFELKIALRYLKSRRKQKFISIISLISVAGIAIGVMSLIVIIAVMTGFGEDWREKIVGANAHVFIQGPAGIQQPDLVIEKILQNPSVEAAASYITGQVIVKNEQLARGVELRGIDPEKEIKVTQINKYLRAGQLPFYEEDVKNKKSIGSVMLGRELAELLRLWIGDEINVISAADGKEYKGYVGGVFEFGVYDYDANIIFTSLEAAQKLFEMPPDTAAGIGVRLDDFNKADKIKKDLHRQLDYKYWIFSWMDINRKLFSAMKLEKIAMFIILSLIVIVAAFNIVSALIMVVMEKTKDIGILRSIGATARSIYFIFTLEGLFIGVIGTAIGACLGFLVVYLQENYGLIKIPEASREAYLLETFPVKLQYFDSVVIIVCAVLISFISTIYPARSAARLNPVEALRYE